MPVTHKAMSRKSTNPYDAHERLFKLIVATVAVITVTLVVLARRPSSEVTRFHPAPAASADVTARPSNAGSATAEFRQPATGRSERDSNVLIAGGKTYVLPSYDASRDEQRLVALERNCYAAARANESGRMPATQRQACADYARHAAQMGREVWLPPVQDHPPPVRPAPSPETPMPAQEGLRNCAALYAHKRRLEAEGRKPHSARRAEYLNEEMRKVIRELDRMRCTETG
jgi:hypothetical protein